MKPYLCQMLSDLAHKLHLHIKLIFAGLLIVCISSAYTIYTNTTENKPVILDHKKIPLEEIGNLPKVLKEASGLAITEGKNFWSHNDDGIPALYCMDSVGNLIKAIHLNAKNSGWEDLALDDKGNLYIGGFGNNDNTKRDLKIYKIANPDQVEAPVTIPEIIHYTYSDQKEFPPSAAAKNFDVDAFVFFNDALWLFTKNRTVPFTGYSKIYRLMPKPGNQVAELVDSVFIGKGAMLNHWLTGADISPDKTTLALLFHDHVLFIKDFQHTSFSKGKAYKLPLQHFSHKAGIAFKNNNEIYIVDEREFNWLGGKLYKLKLNATLENLTL